jgi:hypothetical protein
MGSRLVCSCLLGLNWFTSFFGSLQQPEGCPEDLGAVGERDVKKTKVVERHVTSEPGKVVRSRRHKALVSAKREGEKVFKRGTRKYLREHSRSLEAIGYLVGFPTFWPTIMVPTRGPPG